MSSEGDKREIDNESIEEQKKTPQEPITCEPTPEKDNREEGEEK